MDEDKWKSAPYMVRVVECSHLSFLQVGLFIVKEKGACAFAGARASDIAGFFRAAFVIAFLRRPAARGAYDRAW